MEYTNNYKQHSDYMLGNLKSKRLQEFFNIEKCNIFVETGTYKGDGALWATEQNHFEQIYSVELHLGLFEYSKRRLSNYSNVTIKNGDTVEFLNSLLPTLNKPTLLYLDAHISGSDSSHNPNHPVPLVQETTTIFSKFYDLNQLIVVVDDERLWGDGMLNHLKTMYAEKGMVDSYVDDSVVFCNKSWLKNAQDVNHEPSLQVTLNTP